MDIVQITQNRLHVGLSWDPNETMSVYDTAPKPHDMDLSCAVLDGSGKVLSLIVPPYPQRSAYPQAIFHGGDNMSGGSDFEDEYVRLNLEKMPGEVHALAFIVSTKGNLRFHQVSKPFFDVRDEADDRHIFLLDIKGMKFDVAAHAPDIAMVCVLSREGAGWALRKCGGPIVSMEHDVIEKAVKERLVA